MNTEHYIDGEHNDGVFNSGNLNVYGYCYQNPIILIDPNGKQSFSPLLEGIYAHRAFTKHFRENVDPSQTKWVANRSVSGIKDLSRPDLRTGKLVEKGGVWELKRGGDMFISSSLANKMLAQSEAEWYKDKMQKLEPNKTWGVGSSAGAPEPFTGTLELKDEKSGMNFIYVNAGNGAILWYKLEESKNNPISSPVFYPAPVPTSVLEKVASFLRTIIIATTPVAPISLIPPIIYQPELIDTNQQYEQMYDPL